MAQEKGILKFPLGKEFRVEPVFASEAICGKKQTGKLVYVHPLGRFGVLEFEGVNGKCRESFWPEELNG